MSDTPRTDERLRTTSLMNTLDALNDLYDFARTLERELNEARLAQQVHLAQVKVEMERAERAEAKLAAQGHITFVTRDGDPELMAVTRTDDEGRILETLWERPALRPDPLGEALNSGDGSYRP